MNKSELARQYRTKHPDMPNLKLARIIYAENKLVFSGVEQVRGLLRRIEGNNGTYHRSKMKGEDFKKFVREARSYNPYKLPESEEKEYKPYIIKGHQRIGILTDIHFPYHCVESLTEALTRFKKEKVDAVLLNGDIIDCHSLSRFNKDPRKRNFAFELNMLKDFFDKLEQILNCKVYYKIGNHEIRYEHYLFMKAHELVGIEEFEFKNIIKAKEKGIEIIESNQFMKLNELNGIHGHEYIQSISVPVNIARGLYLKGKVSAFQGHNHATSEHTETNMDGKVTTTWSIGCMCLLNPGYMPLNKWNNGYAIVDLDSNGKDYLFRNYRIYKGKTL